MVRRRRARPYCPARARSAGSSTIDLVPDLDHAVAPRLVDAERFQHLLDVAALRLGILVRDVAHMQDHVGLDHLLQRGAERRDQHGRQIGNEADGVGQDHPGAMRQVDRAQGRIERRKQHVGFQHLARASCG